MATKIKNNMLIVVNVVGHRAEAGPAGKGQGVGECECGEGGGGVHDSALTIKGNEHAAYGSNRLKFVKNV